MALLAPPPRKPFPVAYADDSNLNRVHFRLQILGLTTTTILVTTWFITLGQYIPAILALVVAKHVLVAILAMGLGLDDRSPGKPWASPDGSMDHIRRCRT